VTRGVDKFYQMVQALFGWYSRTCHPQLIELSQLSMLAGSACSTGLATTVLTWLGGLLPKNRHCSTIDKQLEVKYSFLQTGLQSYIHGDIQQVAIVSWLMVAPWVLRLFPDLTVVTHATSLRALEFLHC
jgi:hypothetical protein